MRKTIAIFCIISTFLSPKLVAANDTFFDYQNYNHGYCPDCNYYPCRCDTGYTPCPTCPNSTVPPAPYPQDPDACPNGACGTCNDVCDPGAPVCKSTCGISICAIAVAIAAVAAAAAIIVGSSNGSGS